MEREKEDAYCRVLGLAELCAESLFTPGSTCDRLYLAAYDARSRLAGRLGTDFEDRDLEILWQALEAIQHAVARRMYDCGRARERWRGSAPTSAVRQSARPPGARQPPPGRN